MTTFICGPMFSSKTTELFRNLERFIYAKKKVCLIRPSIDNRVSISHNKATEVLFDKLKIDTFFRSNSLPNDDTLLDKYDVIGIDECQFVNDLKDLLVYLKDKQVFMSGLLATSENKLFPAIADALPYCEDIVKLNAVCSQCGSLLGNFTYYKHGSKSEKVLVGGSNLYEARCADCINY